VLAAVMKDHCLRYAIDRQAMNTAFCYDGRGTGHAEPVRDGEGKGYR
jgi:hypothetical protein